MLQILNLAIGLSFVYLLFSLLVSALNEAIRSLLNTRSKFLYQGLQELLADQNMVDRFKAHGLIDAFSRETNGKPTYITASAFASALLDCVCPAVASAPRTLAELKTAIAQMADPTKVGEQSMGLQKLQQSLTALLDRASLKMTADADILLGFRRELEGWFNDAMVRVSGWYKRFAQIWLFILGFSLALFCNVDSIHIVQSLSTDRASLDNLVKEASSYLDQHPELGVKAQPASVAPDAAAKTQAASDPEVTSLAEVQSAVGKYQDAFAGLNGITVPIGWGEAQVRYYFGGADASSGRIAWSLFMGFLGWLCTALAATLGAPFWFDLLKRFVDIRGNGNSPSEADAKKVKDV